MNNLIGLLISILSTIALTSPALGNEVILPLKALPQELVVEKKSQVDEDFVAEQISESIYKLGRKFELNPTFVEAKWIGFGFLFLISRVNFIFLCRGFLRRLNSSTPCEWQWQSHHSRF